MEGERQSVFFQAKLGQKKNNQDRNYTQEQKSQYPLKQYLVPLRIQDLAWGPKYSFTGDTVGEKIVASKSHNAP